MLTEAESLLTRSTMPSAISVDGAEIQRVLVNGQAISELPADLYIPPDALEILLENFEGPLDLLLYLIKRQNIDILDIPIASVTRQYMAYIDKMREMRIELAADYLLMAAILAEVKSKMLLPRPPAPIGEDEDPRAELVRRLQEYERYREAARALDELPRVERDIFVVALPYEVKNESRPILNFPDLMSALQDVLQRGDMRASHIISREALSVRARMAAVLDRLQQCQRLVFSELFECKEAKAGAVVALLAILELCKEGLIDIQACEDGLLQICLA